MDFGRVLIHKQGDIIRSWMTQVKAAGGIESTHDLTSQAILDSLPQLIGAIAHLLSQPTSADLKTLLTHGIDHGSLRAKQGYDAEEIAREYSLLRDAIFDALASELLESDPQQMLRTVRVVDGAIDKAIGFCMKRYTDERLRDVNLLYDELLVSNQELDWLVRTERNNLSQLAHELKSPLSSIIGFSELFLRQYDKLAKVHPDYVERVLTSGRQLLAMIDETLEISSYLSGRVALEAQPVEVCQVVDEVVMALEILAQQKDLPISVACEPIEIPVMTDGGRLRQIVTNLLSNAIRYTESGRIDIYVRPLKAGMFSLAGHPPSEAGPGDCAGDLPKDLALARRQAARLAIQSDAEEVMGDRVEIKITDTGLGIDAAEQSHVFEPYYQGHAGQQLSESTGLGLAITHQMVKLLQGSIHLMSEPDIGSTFTITLPMCYQAERAATGHPNFQK